MRARDVVGRRIVRVEQSHRPTREYGGGPRDYEWVLNRIVLDNGTSLTFHTLETDFGDYEVAVVAHKRKKS